MKSPSTFDRISEPLPTRIAVGLNKLGLAMKQRSWADAAEDGLSPTQAQILALLSASPGLRASVVAQKLALTPPTVSDSVRVLIEKGLVEKLADPADQRAGLLRLTRKGKPLAARATGWPEFLTGAIDALSLPEQTVFLQGVVKMIRTLQLNGEIPVSHMCLTCVHFRPNVHPGDEPHHCAFVDAAFGARHLRLECSDHQPATPQQEKDAWAAFQSP